MSKSSKQRCGWCGDDPLYIAYHDKEWGVPKYNDQELFELLVLEGAQAGLSWITILRRRETYRKAYNNFDPELLARWQAADIRKLMKDPGIIRNRLKIESARKNARAYLAIQEQQGFANFIWDICGGEPRQNKWRTMAQLPAKSATSDALSKALKRSGFNFVGSTICYAFMQAAGMVNDHLVTCFRWKACKPC